MNRSSILSTALIVGGLVLLALGALARILPIGRLPGDIVVRKPGFTFAFPIATSILLSVLLTLALWVAGRFLAR